MAKTILDSEPLEDHTPRAVDGNNAVEYAGRAPRAIESRRPCPSSVIRSVVILTRSNRSLQRESCHPVGPCPGLSQSFLRGCSSPFLPFRRHLRSDPGDSLRLSRTSLRKTDPRIRSTFFLAFW